MGLSYSTKLHGGTQNKTGNEQKLKWLPFDSGYNLIFLGGSWSRGSLTTSPITECGGKSAGDAMPEISDHILHCFVWIPIL